MISVYSFEPKYFDNNGDQANLVVLTRLLKAQSVLATQASDPVSADFVLIGDCSIAVLEKFKFQLQELVPALKTRLEAALPTLLVGRSYEYLAPLLGIEVGYSERTSAFLELESGFGSIWGYHNSELFFPRFFSHGHFIATTLFGPVLAKNPALTQEICKRLGVKLESEFFEQAVQLSQLAKANTTFG